MLPELAEELRSAALFEAREFLKVPHFKIERGYGDVFIECLKKNPLVFDKLLAGWDGKEPFDKWRANGMPKGEERINKPRIPFFLWNDSDTEMKDARILYDANQNCIKVNVEDFYDYVSKNFPLFGHNSSWCGITNESVAKELIEYMEFKLGIKPDEE
jgi:hypothetical protein